MNKRKNEKIFIIVIFFTLLWLNNTGLFSKKDNTGYKFLYRMEKSNTRAEITSGKASISEGFDSIESLKNIPKNFSGLIWTNRIDIVYTDTLKEPN